MGLIEFGALSAVALMFRKERKESKKAAELERKRRETHCTFTKELTRSMFKRIAIEEAKKIRRLWVDVEGTVIDGWVKSVSGLSEWHFTLDFNDFGRITGEYWLSRDNYDSDVPDIYAERIQKRIEAYLE